MAITTGKAQVKADIEAKFESIRTTLKTTLKDADDILATITDPAQNAAKREERYNKMLDAIKQAIVDSLDKFFDSYSNNITTNAQVVTGIPVQVSLATGSGATTAPGTIT